MWAEAAVICVMIPSLFLSFLPHPPPPFSSSLTLSWTRAQAVLPRMALWSELQQREGGRESGTEGGGGGGGVAFLRHPQQSCSVSVKRSSAHQGGGRQGTLLLGWLGTPLLPSLSLLSSFLWLVLSFILRWNIEGISRPSRLWALMVTIATNGALRVRVGGRFLLLGEAVSTFANWSRDYFRNYSESSV